MSPPRPASPRRLLYVANEDYAFLMHRLPMARAARDAGYEVHVATNVNTGAPAIAAERFVLHPIPFRRGGLSPATALPTGSVALEVTFVPPPGQKLDDRWGDPTMLDVSASPAELLVDGFGIPEQLRYAEMLHPENIVDT